jgi:transposase
MVAGIDVHTKMLAVVAGSVELPDSLWQRRKFGTTHLELQALQAWLQEVGVTEVAMESTALYWRPVYLSLEGSFRLHLAQARSNAAPRGRKSDFADATRIVRRLLSGDLTLSFVPDAEQRRWRILARTRVQFCELIVQMRNQIEGLLEEAQIKLSSCVTDLFGASGWRILTAPAKGEKDANQLAALADPHLAASQAQLRDALHGNLHEYHCAVLTVLMEQVSTTQKHLAKLDQTLAQAQQTHQQALKRLCEVPGIRVLAAQQILAEVGADAASFAAPEKLTSWAGICPGRKESAGECSTSRSPKGNRYLRRIMAQVAWAAVRTRDCQWQRLFHRLLPRLGSGKAIWAVAHRILRVIWRLLHNQEEYREPNLAQMDPHKRERRKRRLLKELRLLGFEATLQPTARPLAG